MYVAVFEITCRRGKANSYLNAWPLVFRANLPLRNSLVGFAGVDEVGHAGDCLFILDIDEADFLHFRLQPAGRDGAGFRGEGHMLELPERGHDGAGAVILDHEIMNHDPAARRQAVIGIFHQPRDFAARNAAEQIGHQDGVLFGRPFHGQRVGGDIADAVGHVGIGDEAPADLADIRKIDDGRAQLRVGLQQANGHGAGAAADIEQGRGTGKINGAGQ